jgi:hypothetical protein
MKNPLIALALIPALSLGGCGTIEGLFSSNTTTNAASLSQLNVVVKQLETAGVVVICDISSLSNVAAQVEAAAQASQSITGTTSKVLAASTVACTALGAIAGASVSVPAGTTVIQ